jgi:capsular polysaccharide export protein
MISQGIQAFSNKKILLLQGPIGPFFARLAKDLRAVDAQVHKVNFNGGDWLFFPADAINYRGGMAHWPAYLEALLLRLRIDVVILMGDCRPIHRAAHEVATRLGLEVGVFEEGYIRPDFVTLERFGVNGNSRISKNPATYVAAAAKMPKLIPVAKPYWYMVLFGFLYYIAGSLGKPFFPNYIHHRPLHLAEGLAWVRSVWRKQKYRLKERGIQSKLTTELQGRYFLVPLQVFNDAQVTVHSKLGCVENFIELTLESFARNSPVGTMLVLKHHPMDRGYRDYTALIKRIAHELGISKRVLYVHDLNTPALLDHARGVVVINSTVGLSALAHKAPTKTCGSAMYDLPGLTFQGSLDAFWHAAQTCKPDEILFDNFRSHLIVRTQLNGSFYRRLKLPASATGLVWGRGLHLVETPGDKSVVHVLDLIERGYDARPPGVVEVNRKR